MKYPNELINAVLRQDFNSFIHKVFNTINPGSNFEPNWHLELIAEYLEAIRKGDITRLIINIPPRSLKSICVSVAWPAWVLGHDPTKRIITASYSQILSIKHSLDCRLILSSDWYKTIFSKTILSKYHNQKSKFLTTLNGFRFASSISGSITGEGGDFLIIDDPHNPLHINSNLKRNKVIEWFEQVFLTRLNNKEKGAIILVMQRLHFEDLSGYLLNNHSIWHQLKIPIETNIPLEFKIHNIKHTFLPGNSLHSARDKIEDLQKLKNAIGNVNYNSQYLQEPLINTYSLLRLEDISFYQTLPKVFEYFVQSWDTAITISDSSDYSVCTCYGIKDNKYYLIEAFREKITYPFLKKEVYKLNYKFNPKYILIENKASGQQLIQELQSENLLKIVSCKPKFDKMIRFSSILHYFHIGKILLPKEGHVHKLLLNEIISYPYSKNDDIIDSISQFLIFMRDQFDIKATPRIRAF